MNGMLFYVGVYDEGNRLHSFFTGNCFQCLLQVEANLSLSVLEKKQWQSITKKYRKIWSDFISWDPTNSVPEAKHHGPDFKCLWMLV